MKNRLIVALDVHSLKKAKALVDKLYPAVKIFKVGSELFTSCGPEAVRMIHNKGAKVFLDLKFHDIPNTVAGAVQAAKEMGVFMINAHSSGGEEMLKAAAQARGRSKRPIILAVTVLTSLDDEELKKVGVKTLARAQVRALTLLAKSAGLDGAVCSPREIKAVRKACGKRFLIVTPGIRPARPGSAGRGGPASTKREDQKRIATPKKAVGDGADYIVVGRPITRAGDPLKAARAIIADS